MSGQCLFGQASSGCTGYTTAAVSECDGTYSMPVIDAQWNIDLRIDEFVSLYSGLAPDSIQRMETVAGMSIPDVDFILGPWRENPHITRL
ncbi:MAG: hypothetical protein GTO30_22600, partial [Acidobacteria bacterium]|nr:hypothetical protein [Acidobacteriota bacterium]NIQ86509.1 hypothetical protein [Acidobacteriota bacterium]